MRAFVALGVCLLLNGACAAKRLPPGTPAPEYEIREPAPWVDPADAGPTPLDSSVPAPGDAEAPKGTVDPRLPPSEMAPDAGPAVDGPSPDAGVR